MTCQSQAVFVPNYNTLDRDLGHWLPKGRSHRSCQGCRTGLLDGFSLLEILWQGRVWRERNGPFTGSSGAIPSKQWHLLNLLSKYQPPSTHTFKKENVLFYSIFKIFSVSFKNIFHLLFTNIGLFIILYNYFLFSQFYFLSHGFVSGFSVSWFGWKWPL